ncbi:MAG: tetraacyldisaccharide 4'-kinase [Parachlamydiaceae bacterium]|nr:tetraacyldisaccharide 4'-kinase [Parachlamydiaceae bacterium]
MLKHWQLYFSEVIKGKRRGKRIKVLQSFLKLLSWPFAGAVKLRNWAYDSDYLRGHAPSHPVIISVGNIVAGGTGKTPITQMLARALSDYARVAILSRGYHSPAEHSVEPLVLSEGKGPLYPPTECGDEPYMLSKQLPHIGVFVGRDRRRAAAMAADSGAQVIIVDDGMQHRRLSRDYDVVVVNANDPFGQGHFLPRGFLRDSPRSLSRAHLLIINHIRDTQHYEEIKALVDPYSKAPTIGTRLEVRQVLDMDSQPISDLKDKQVGIFCGIAHPEHFLQTVSQLGAQTVTECVLPDHHSVSAEELIAFAKESKARGAQMLLCTEKDYVKLAHDLKLDLPVGWVQMQLNIVADEAHWKEFIDKAHRCVNNAGFCCEL